MEETPEKTDRQFPAFYEKVVPAFVAVFVVLLVGVLLFTFAVALGFI